MKIPWELLLIVILAIVALFVYLGFTIESDRDYIESLEQRIDTFEAVQRGEMFVEDREVPFLFQNRRASIWIDIEQWRQSAMVGDTVYISLSTDTIKISGTK